MRFFLKKSHEVSGCRSSVLGRCKTPRMKVAQMTDRSSWFLEQRRLDVLHKVAKRAALFTEDLQDRLVVHNLMCSHVDNLAIRTPHHTATRPKNRLRAT